jgi:uncharacterized repeat protein (TIGR01451 family)
VRKAIFVAVLTMVAVAAMALAGAGSAAKSTTGVPATPRAVDTHAGTYLVRQVGARNYAGPNCPGAGWNCTTATRVLQVATVGGTNSATCTTISTPCSITQTGTTNTARCSQSSSAVPTVTETCTINQTGATNYAYVNQSITQSIGLIQTGKQTATVTQSGASVLNQLQLNQNGNQSSKTSATGTTQSQDVFQSAVVVQCAGALVGLVCTANGAGTNYSGMTQSQLQKAYARGTVQNQNKANLPVGFADCVALSADTPNSPGNPDICADVQQHSDAGTNENHLRQSINEDENSTGQATQQQGHLDGGLDGHVHQDTVSASSLNDVNQSKNQHATAAAGSPTQVQFDPLWCCGFGSQFGGSGNTENITQSSALSASGPSPDQESKLIGTSRTPDGTCTISQHASINPDSFNISDTESPCEFLTLETDCTEGDCSSDGPDTSSPFVPDSSLDLSVRDDVDSPFVYTLDHAVIGGDPVEYRLLYSNSGTGAAHNVVVTDELPDTLVVYAYVSCTGGLSCSYDGDTHTITWNVGTVDPTGESPVGLGFTVEVGCGTSFVNHATVDTDEEAPTNSNDATVPLFGCIE